jgi:hypothetical protein
MDFSAIGNALIAKLGADATLLGLMPNGVYRAESPPGSTRFVIVSKVDGHNEYELSGRLAWTDAVYLVEARALSTSGGDVHAAAVRIDALLNPPPSSAPATLSVSGWTLVELTCEEPVEDVEVDGVDPAIRWFRRGGMYRIQMAPTY